MAEKVSLSTDTPDYEDVAEFYRDAERSIRLYYATAAAQPTDPRFVGLSVHELNRERDDRLFTLDQTCAFVALAALEAGFRTDFHVRCAMRLKDDLSRHFRKIQRDKRQRISLEDDILNGWRDHAAVDKLLLSQLKAALNYRHWFAHGRYYTPKLGHKYDFTTVYTLAQLIAQSVSLKRQGN